MFVHLEGEDVYSLYCFEDGRNERYVSTVINTNHISHIVGNSVIVKDYRITLTDKGLDKILSSITISK